MKRANFDIINKLEQLIIYVYFIQLKFKAK